MAEMTIPLLDVRKPAFERWLTKNHMALLWQNWHDHLLLFPRLGL